MQQRIGQQHISNPETSEIHLQDFVFSSQSTEHLL
jgi:hypothetical protein